MELKLVFTRPAADAQATFNRTVVELKPVSGGVWNIDAGAFNRTVVELKRYRVKAILKKCVALLTVP